MKTHEVKMPVKQFQDLANKPDYLIVEQTDRAYEQTDVILFIAIVGEETTGQTLLTQVESVNTDPGLKDGYVLIKLKELRG